MLQRSDGKQEEIGIVIIDEIHMLGDGHRGQALETLLIKLNLLQLRLRSRGLSMQMVGLSATLSDQSQKNIAHFLRAAKFSANERPIPLLSSTSTLHSAHFCSVSW